MKTPRSSSSLDHRIRATEGRRGAALLGAALLTLALTAGATGAATAVPAHQDAVTVTTSAKAKKYAPTLKADKAVVVKGQKLIISGQVKPATAKGKVILQKRIGEKKTWKVEKNLTMSGKGTFEYQDKPSAPGVRQYRVVVPGHGSISTGRSKTIKVTVYRWTSLTKVTTRSRSHIVHERRVSINAKDFAPAYTGTDYSYRGHVDWNLDRECTKLRARFGNNDDSDELAQAAVSLTVDGKAVYAKTFGLAQSQYKVLDITNGFRVGFNWTSSNPEHGPQNQEGAAATFAEPEVLCAF